MSGWSSDEDWAWAEDRVPIPCVDLLPILVVDGDASPQVGLIRRRVPEGDVRWALIGGRIRRDESLLDAVRRHVVETLGVEPVIAGTDPQPVYVAQYFPERRQGFPWDPRKHAVSLTFVAALNGNPSARGEALEFSWFDAENLPSSRSFGFGQDLVVQACLRLIREIPGLVRCEPAGH
jgi:ADP-ribose pyrophosphatase YjhB (NUDIX family)